MTSLPFIHLRAQSAYSLLEGAMPVPKLVGLAREMACPALGLTDRSGLMGALEFSEKASAAGMQPITGLTLAVALDGKEADKRVGSERPKSWPTLGLIAANQQGYRNLMVLSSKAYLETDAQDDPHVSEEMLAAHADGIICLTGGVNGPVGDALEHGNLKQAEWTLDILARLFDDRLYVELQRHGLETEERVEPGLINLAYDKGLPLVATNSVLFAKRDDYSAHDAMLCIADSKAVADEERRRLTPEFHFKTADGMARLFADLPEAVASTAEIAQRCRFRPVTHPPILPRFATETETEVGGTSDGVEAEFAELTQQAKDGLDVRLETQPLAEGFTRTDYDDRLAYELEVIGNMGFPGYFLIVADFIKWAKNHDIPVGPGRGSGAGSLVAWSLTITDLDPMRFGLLFERFLNPERVSMPDFDIDFCPTGRDAVIGYVQERYGADQVAQIITFGSLQARAVVRDVARVLGVPFGQADRLSKMIPNNPANPVKLAEAIAGEEKLRAARDEDPTVARLLEIALKLEGLYRHASTHAAGIVIGDRPLDQLVPLYKDPRSSMPATQFNMKWVEPAGLVKFDFLGLKTLTVIEKTRQLVRDRGIEIDLERLPLDDEKTYAMLSRAETVGIFQLESAGMRSAILGMRPDRFEDIIALVALYRPGPMENIPTYNQRKHGLEEPDYIHPMIKPFLEETFGVIVYQEQVMQIAQELAGYSLGDADLLRRAMGKKIQAEMDKQRPRFLEGAKAKGVDEKKAREIFDLLDKFANYGFNKSHAAAYALVAYQTAWLKANYPVEFLAASMTVDISNTAKLNDFRREAQRLEIDVLPPDVNASVTDFSVQDGAIRYALAAIRNVGRQAIDHIVAERDGEGRFASLPDFAGRVSPRMLNRRALESLSAAGTFDSVEPNRALVMESVDAMLAAAQRGDNARIGGQDDMFGAASEQPLAVKAVPDWLPAEKLRREFEALGSFLTGHPLDEYQTVLERRRCKSLVELVAAAGSGAAAGRVAGIVVSKMERRTRFGSKIAVVELSDPSGQIELVAYAEDFAAWQEHLEIGTAVMAIVGIDKGQDNVRYRLKSLEPLETVARQIEHSLRVFVREAEPMQHVQATLKDRGNCEVSVIVLGEEGREIEVRLPHRYDVTPQIAAALKAVPGVVSAELS